MKPSPVKPPSINKMEIPPPAFTRGHWKRESYGPGRTLQRTVWVPLAIERESKSRAAK